MLRVLFFWIISIVTGTATAIADELPASVAQALKQHRLSRSGLSVYVHAIGDTNPRLAIGADVPRNPASVIKLVTTLAALEELGPGYRWKTEVYGSTPVRNGVLDGDLYIKGYGDPYLVVEHFWRLLRTLRLSGLQTINGDLVLDQSYFDGVVGDPSDFDGEENRAYNVQPRAVLVNFQAVQVRLIPQPPLLRVVTDPVMPVENRVRVADIPCPSGRTWTLRTPQRKRPTLVLEGRYSLNCGEDALFRVVADVGSYTHGVFENLWQEQGGRLLGDWREATVPEGATLLHTFQSPSLAEVVRSINKYSNNVMTRQLLFTLGAERFGSPGSAAKGIQAVQAWLARRGLHFPELVLDNGSGLSRSERISARSLGKLLLAAYDSPYMPEFMSALPVAGVDGTLYRRFTDSPMAGRLHFKTGSLDDVRSGAGYMLDNAGRRVVVVYVHNDGRANGAGAIAVQEALLDWVYEGKADPASPDPSVSAKAPTSR